MLHGEAAEVKSIWKMKRKQKTTLSKKAIAALPRHILKNLNHPLLRLGWALELADPSPHDEGRFFG